MGTARRRRYRRLVPYSVAVTSRSESAENVMERDGLQAAAVDEVEQLRIAVGDGGQVGVGNHNLLGLKRFRRTKVVPPPLSLSSATTRRFMVQAVASERCRSDRGWRWRWRCRRRAPVHR